MANQNITQNNIIMWLEDVVPQMQKSDNPTDTLLKYASDHNFSPAILERVGHMFNSLKTNSFYNLAKEASHRGDYISTLDVDDLVKQYEAFKPNELDFSKIKTNVKDNNIFSTGGSMKLASVSVRTGSINDLTVLSDVEVMSFDDGELKFAKAKKDILNNVDSFKTDSFKIAAPVEKPLFEKDPVDFEMQCKHAKQEAHVEYTKAVDIMESIEKKFASVYSSHSLRNGHIPYANLEYKVLANIDSKQYNSVKEAMDHLSQSLKSRSMFLKETLKTASDAGLLDDPDFIDDGKEATLFNDVLDYTEAYHHAKEASEFIKEIVDTQKKLASTVTLDDVRQAIIDASVAAAAKDKAQEALNNQYTAESDANTQYTQAKMVLEQAKHQADLISQQKDDDRKDKESERKERESRNKEIEKKYDNAIKGMKELGGSASDLLSNTAKSVREAGSDLKENFLGLYQAMLSAKSEGNTSEKLSPVEREVQKLQNRLVLEQLLYTDPVLSKLDSNTTNNLMEAYNSVVRRSPDLASDVGLLRTLLRQIVAAGGVDLTTSSTIARLS